MSRGPGDTVVVIDCPVDYSENMKLREIRGTRLSNVTVPHMHGPSNLSMVE